MTATPSQQRRTPRFLRMLQWLAAATVIAFGGFAAGWLLFTGNQLTAATVSVSQATHAGQAQTAVLAADQAATWWAIDKNATAASAAHEALRQATAALPGLNPAAEGLTEVSGRFLDYAVTVSAAIDSGQPSAVPATHKTATQTLSPKLADWRTASLQAASATTNAATWPVQLGAVLGGALLLVAIVLLAQRTRRLINLGLVGALAVLAAISALALWPLNGLADTASGLSSGPASKLATVRTATISAMTDENLILATKSTSLESAWSTHFKTADAAADDAELAAALATLESAHGKVKTLAAVGKWAEAVSAASPSSGSRQAFSAVLARLDALDSAAAKATDSLGTAQAPLLPLAVLVVLLSLLGGGLAAAGVGQRLREYR